MSLRTFFVALGAALIFTAAIGANATAQTPTGTPSPSTPLAPSPQPMPIMQPVPPAAPQPTAMPMMMPATPPSPAAPSITSGMPIQPVTFSPTTLTTPTMPTTPIIAPTTPAFTTIDPNRDTTVMLLDRIHTLVGNALDQTTDAKLDKSIVYKKLAGSGTVTIDRAALDEIQALASQISAMYPPRPRP